MAVCTFNRPVGLQKVLTELVLQSEELRPALDTIISVIDNSSDGSAFWVTRDPKFGKNVVYLQCTEQGLSNARNSALDLANLEATAVAFIDDDEIPNKNWLATAFFGIRKFENEILVGPVVPDFEGAEEPKLIPDFFWERKIRSDSSIVKELVGDGNIVYPASLVSEGLRYSSEFNLTGGQDTDFLIRAKAKGFNIRNLNGLSVDENIPLARQTIGYLMDRAQFSSCAWVKVRLANGDSKWTLIPSLIKRLSLSAIFATKFFFGRSLSARVSWVVNTAIVRGTVLGMRQRVINRYEKYQSD